MVDEMTDPLALESHIKQPGPAPVHLWNPPFCGDMDMRIAVDGSWHYRGSPLGRMAMVRLFSSVLKREGDEYFLVTPVEKLRIRVDDCPFVAGDLTIHGKEPTQTLEFTINTGESVIAGAEHIIEVRDDQSGNPRPRLHVRNNLWALISRSVFYRLVDAAHKHSHGGGKELRIGSDGQYFSLGRLSPDESQ